MKKYNSGCGCNDEEKDVIKECGCVIDLLTDCIYWDGNKEVYKNGTTLTKIITNLKNSIDEINKSFDLIPKPIIEEYLINPEELLYETSYNFIPSTMEVFIDGIKIEEGFELRDYKEVLFESLEGSRVKFKYKTLDDA